MRHSISCYGHLSQIQTLLNLEPIKWKKDVDYNGGEEITELLRAPPANTSMMGLSHTSSYKLVQEKQQMGKRVGSIQTAMLTGEMEQEGIELTLKADSSCV
jgi:hypothetical protein